MPNLVDLVDQRFSEFDGENVPGCALSIISEGEVVYERGYGLANIEEGVPYTPNTITSLCSIAKQFTAMSIALLEEDGHLSLNDDIREYLPELPEYEAPVTIQHLLYHTSGIRDSFQLFLLQGLSEVEAYVTEEEVFEQLSNIGGLNFAPGDQHIYCNSGYIFLAMILKRSAGMSLVDFVQKRILDPLGMEDTFFVSELPNVNGQVATGYFGRGQDVFDPVTPIPDQAIGSGGIWSTPENLYLWDQNFYDNRLGGGQDLIRGLELPGMLNSGEKIRYARGQKTSEYRGLKILGHDGSGRGFKSAILRIPEHRFSVVCLSNRSDGEHPWSCCMDVVMYYLRESMDWSPRPKSGSKPGAERSLKQLSECEDLPFVLDDFTGTYTCDELSVTYEVVKIEGDLHFELDTPKTEPLFLTPFLIWKVGDNPSGYETDLFRIRHAKMPVDVEFLRNAEGSIEGFSLNSPRAKSLRFKRSR